ncbi:hypothetical protein PFISCL1PPCAC_11120, partial [Pristionchus fissidentatus]
LQSPLKFAFKEDLPGRFCQCYQFADGTIIYHSNTELFTFVNGNRIDADLSVFENMDYEDMSMKENSLFLLMFDRARHEKGEKHIRKLFNAVIEGGQLVINLMNELDLPQGMTILPCSPHSMHEVGGRIYIRELAYNGKKAMLKSISNYQSVTDGYPIFFKDTIYFVCHAKEVEILRTSADVVQIHMPYSVLHEKLTVHGYAKSGIQYLVNCGKGMLIALNTVDLSHRTWRFERPPSCPHDSYDYSIGIHNNVITVRFLDETSGNAQLWTANI